MARILTEEDIVKFNLKGSFAGDVATDADLEAMGEKSAEAIESAPTIAPSQTTLDYSTARAGGADPATAPQSGGFPLGESVQTSPAMGAGTTGANSLMGLLAQSNPIPQDPYENLSRNQRMMIGFAALKDAGMALQGKEGGAVRGVMDDITARADMERKRQAAVARQQMMGSLMGGELSRQAIINAMAQGLIDGPTGTAMLAEKDRSEKDIAGDRGKGRAAANQLETLQQIMSRVEEDPTMTTGPIAMFMRNVPFSKAGKTQALVDSLKATLALDTLKDLKATGATMGALNREELKVIMDDITLLDLAQGPKAVKESLARIDRKYKSVIRDLYSGAAEVDLPMLDEVFGGRPTWLDPSTDAPATPATPATTSVEGKTWNPKTQRFE